MKSVSVNFKQNVERKIVNSNMFLLLKVTKPCVNLLSLNLCLYLGFTTDRLPVFSIAVNESGLPKGGDEITLRITCVKTVCNFYIHLNPFLHDTGSNSKF